MLCSIASQAQAHGHATRRASVQRHTRGEAPLIRACCTKPKPLAINSLSGIDSCSAPRKSGKIRQNPSTPAQVDVPKS
jgi:hypothetical protein